MEFTGFLFVPSVVLSIAVAHGRAASAESARQTSATGAALLHTKNRSETAITRPARATTVTQIVVTARQVLRNVAQLVLPQHTEWPAPPRLNAKVDPRMLKPARALKTIVNQFAMTAQRMPEQQH